MSVKFILGTAEFVYPKDPADGCDAYEFGRFDQLLEEWMSLGFSHVDLPLNHQRLLGKIGCAQGSPLDLSVRIPQGLDVEYLQTSIEMACHQTRQPTLYAVLFQSEDELLVHDFDERMSILHRLRQQGRIKKVGVLVQDIDAIYPLLNNVSIQLIQVPFNTLDRRAARAIERLKQSRPDLEIQASSVYLRGALLSNPTSLPSHLNVLQEEVDWFLNYCDDHQMNPGVAALRVILQHPIDALIVDAADKHELQNAYSWFKQAQAMDFSVPERPFHKQFDPRCW